MDSGFPSPYVAYAVLSLVGILLILAGLGALAEGAKKQAKRFDLSKRFQAVKMERARLRWVDEIKQPKDVEPV